MAKYSKKEKEQYSFENYKSSKSCKPVTVNGVDYLSKKQACVLEDMTMKELNEYLKNN